MCVAVRVRMVLCNLLHDKNVCVDTSNYGKKRNFYLFFFFYDQCVNLCVKPLPTG